MARFASFAGIYANGGLWDSLIHGRPDKSVGRIALADGRLVEIQRRHARMSTIERSATPGVLQLRLESVSGTHILTGEPALRAAARLMPTVNRFGGTRANVRDAVSLLEEAGDPLRVLANVQERHGARADQARWKRKSGRWSGEGLVKKLPGALHTLPSNYRLALEMALHEESERRAMDGELADLERAWREAEEIAKIADDMFVLPSVNAKIERLHRPHESDN